MFVEGGGVEKSGGDQAQLALWIDPTDDDDDDDNTVKKKHRVKPTADHHINIQRSLNSRKMFGGGQNKGGCFFLTILLARRQFYLRSKRFTDFSRTW